MNNSTHHFPRLYCSDFRKNFDSLDLSENQSHYLKNVLRKKTGDKIRIFNSEQGEWLTEIKTESKKGVTLNCLKQIRPPNLDSIQRHLIFSPIKKDRQDFLIEKAVELGVTHLHPVLFARSIIRDIKPERITSQIIEAAEQCERMTIPILSPILDLKKKLKDWNKNLLIYAAIERSNVPALITHSPFTHDCTFLVGPEGGITEDENKLFSKMNYIHPISLGKNILRSETAALYGLSCLGH